MDIREIRLNNFKRLLKQEEMDGGVRGSRKRFAEKVGTAPAYLSQLSANGNEASIGNDLARRIETAYDLPFGWMDSPQEAPETGPSVFVNSVPMAALAWPFSIDYEDFIELPEGLKAYLDGIVVSVCAAWSAENKKLQKLEGHVYQEVAAEVAKALRQQISRRMAGKPPPTAEDQRAAAQQAELAVLKSRHAQLSQLIHQFDNDQKSAIVLLQRLQVELEMLGAGNQANLSEAIENLRKLPETIPTAAEQRSAR